MGIRNTQNARLVARACPVPETASALQSLDRVDYADAFRVLLPADEALDAEAWARAALEQAWPGAGSLRPALPRDVAVRIWWALVAWRRRPAVRQGRVAGWKIARRTDAAIRIDAAPRWGSVQIVFVVMPDAQRRKALVMATFVRFDGWTGRAFFALIRPAHRRVAAFLIARAASTHRRNPRAGFDVT
ncbi:MAG: DUF2867 domain-containing protein [Chloroflexi bacterium]|nr:MAG: DUF2867 domain-containing protein [Chloroflexota bacterium]